MPSPCSTAWGQGRAALWSWLRLPVAGDGYSRAFLRIAILMCLALVGYGLVRETDWQNAIRRAMDMPAVPAGLPILIAIVGVPVALFLIGLARLFNALAMLVSARLAKLVPRRIALLVGFGAVAALFWAIGNGLLMRTALHQLDSSYRHVDALIPAELSAPEDPLKSGSGKSLVSWAGLGAQGRARVVAVPSRSDIASLTGGSAMEPLRVYIGLNSAETVEQRAELALAELKRVGAFDRARAGDRDADRHRLGRSCGHGAARDPLSRRRRVGLGAIFLPAELAFAARRAGHRRGHGARRLSGCIRLLAHPAQGAAAAPLSVRT